MFLGASMAQGLGLVVGPGPFSQLRGAPTKAAKALGLRERGLRLGRGLQPGADIRARRGHTPRLQIDMQQQLLRGGGKLGPARHLVPQMEPLARARRSPASALR